MQRLRVLVTGATGQQGGALARHLVERGHHVRALTRHPNRPEAQRLAHLGAELAQGDYDDADSIRRAAEGMEAVFLVTTPREHGARREAEQGVQVVDALRSSEAHVVHSSIASAADGTGIPHFESKRRIERALAASGLRHTIIAPVFFRENLQSPLWRDGLQQGTLAMPIPPRVRLQNVEVEEIARLTALVMEDAKACDGRRIEIASDENTPAEMARILGRNIGHDVRFRQIPLDAVEDQDPDFAKLFGWLSDGGFHVDMKKLHDAEPEVEWRSFRAWARAQPWPQVLGRMGTLR